MVCFLRFTQLDLISNQVNMMRIKIWDRKKRRKMLVFSINIMIRKYDKCLFETLIVTGTQHEVLISLWLYVVLQSVWYVSLHCGGRKSSSKCVIGYHVQEHCFRWIHISAKDSFFLFINWCPRSYMVYITCWAISHAKLTHHVTHRNKQCAWNHMGLILISEARSCHHGDEMEVSWSTLPKSLFQVELSWLAPLFQCLRNRSGKDINSFQPCQRTS